MAFIADISVSQLTPTSRPGIEVYWYDNEPQPSGAVRITLPDEYGLADVADALNQLADSLRGRI